MHKSSITVRVKLRDRNGIAPGKNPDETEKPEKL